MIIWATQGNSRFVTRGAQKAMLFANRPMPVSPYGIVLKGMARVSGAILFYEAVTGLSDWWMTQTTSGKQWLAGMVAFLGPFH